MLQVALSNWIGRGAEEHIGGSYSCPYVGRVYCRISFRRLFGGCIAAYVFIRLSSFLSPPPPSYLLRPHPIASPHHTYSCLFIPATRGALALRDRSGLREMSVFMCCSVTLFSLRRLSEAKVVVQVRSHRHCYDITST